jgi:excisionase family DNA binding protein
MKKQEPVAHSIPGTCDVTGFGKSTIYEEIAKGNLRARKLGSRTFIMDGDLRAWLESKPEARINYHRA